MADDEVKDSGEHQQTKKTLPPLTSARPVGAASKSLPSPASAKPIGSGQTASRTPAAPHASSTIVVPSSLKAESNANVGNSVPLQAAPAAPRPTAVSKPTTEIRKPKQDKPPEDDNGIWRMSRKNFLNVAGWFGFVSFLLTATIGAIRLMVPRVLYEAPSAFKAGYPEDYIIGEVNEKYKDEFRVWIVREADGLYALSAICTHLGCTPRWAPSDNKFKCPCHGSGYHKDGVNFEGPTPRPLERLKISLADDGQILVDRNIKFLYEKQEWSKPDAFLKYS